MLNDVLEKIRNKEIDRETIKTAENLCFSLEMLGWRLSAAAKP
jgi:hypothetical protein